MNIQHYRRRRVAQVKQAVDLSLAAGMRIVIMKGAAIHSKPDRYNFRPA